MPRARATYGLAKEMYAFDESMHPFPVFDGWTSGNVSAALIATLPARDELFSILDDFQRRAQSCSFPHTPDEVTAKEIERFLADSEVNAQKYPDMLALIFATLATGLQMGEYDRAGAQWVRESMTATMRRADVYSQCTQHTPRWMLLLTPT